MRPRLTLKLRRCCMQFSRKLASLRLNTTNLPIQEFQEYCICRRSVLTGIVGLTALTAAPYAEPKSIQDAKRE